MDRQAEQGAFAKACAYLNYKQGAKWTAHAAAAGTGIVYVALLVVLWLFTDLLVYRGRLPTYHSLTPLQQNSFISEWNALSAEERNDRLQSIGLNDKDRQRLATFQISPSNVSRDDVREIWQAQVGYILVDKLHLEPSAFEGTDIVDFYTTDQGINSLLVRSYTEGRIMTPLIAAVARWAPWTRNANGSQNIPSYLVGLLATGIILGILGHFRERCGLEAEVHLD